MNPHHPTTLSNEELVEMLCRASESLRFEAKLVSGKMVHKALETVVAFANAGGCRHSDPAQRGTPGHLEAGRQLD